MYQSRNKIGELFNSLNLIKSLNLLSKFASKKSDFWLIAANLKVRSFGIWYLFYCISLYRSKYVHIYVCGNVQKALKGQFFGTIYSTICEELVVRLNGSSIYYVSIFLTCSYQPSCLSTHYIDIKTVLNVSKI